MPRGSKPGERRGGRQKGTPNKATADIREAAQQYSAQALEVLVNVATTGESEAAKVAAANAILDRAHGKPKQSVDVDATVAKRIIDMTEEELLAIAAGSGAGGS